METLSQLYPIYQKIIENKAWSFHHSTGIAPDELIAEANLSFCQAYEHYIEKQNKDNFKAFLHQCLKNDLINYIKKNYRHYLTNKAADKHYQPKQRAIAESIIISKERFINNKNPIICRIYKLLVNDPLPKRNGFLYGWLDKILNKEGFSYNEIHKGYKQFKQILQEI